MKSLSHVATRFIGTPLMIHAPKLEVIMNALAPRIGIPVDITGLHTEVDADTQRLMAHYQEAGGDRDYSLINGVAIISVQGVLMKRCSGMDAFSGCCSYLEIQNQLDNAMSDVSVNSVLFDVDSPGGEVSGIFDLADYIYSMRGKKPLYSVANDAALSAAYAIASSADKVFVGRTGAVGSIGVFAMHAEQTELDKKIGVKYTYIFAGENKVDGNPHEPLSDSAKVDIQKEVNREYKLFTDLVARNRGADVKDIVGTKARVSWGDSSVPLLADKVGTFDDAMDELTHKFSGSTNKHAGKAAIKGEIIMTPTEANAAALAANEDEMKKAKANEDEMKKAKADETDDSKKTPDDADEDDAAKKALAGRSVSVASVTPPQISGVGMSVRTEDDMVAIASLCKSSGADLATYLTKKDAVSGKFFSVSEISRDIAENRSAESERTALMNTVDTNHATGKVTMDRIQAEATAFARANRHATQAKLFMPGQRLGTTPEQAFAMALEANPEAYATYRSRHNAQALVNQLEAAGYRLATA